MVSANSTHIGRIHVQWLGVLLHESPVHGEQKQSSNELHEGIAITFDEKLGLELKRDLEALPTNSMHPDAGNGRILSISPGVAAHFLV